MAYWTPQRHRLIASIRWISMNRSGFYLLGNGHSHVVIQEGFIAELVTQGGHLALGLIEFLRTGGSGWGRRIFRFTRSLWEEWETAEFGV